MSYDVLMSSITKDKIQQYRVGIANGQKMGGHLSNGLAGTSANDIDFEAFLEILINTKRPQIFAESQVAGDGSDWNQEELSILGDISFHVPVTVYDNGAHRTPIVHNHPFKGSLVYTPGALLVNGRGFKPVDLEEVADTGVLDSVAYCKLYTRRLMPALLHINTLAKTSGEKAMVTIPGLGCGQFAGGFSGKLGARLNIALRDMLANMAEPLPHIKAIYYDPYNECDNECEMINGVQYLVRPLIRGNDGKSQLSEPSAFGEAFSDCKLYSIVAWDHVSWPGNDYYIGMRGTDDGVKAAATDSMKSIVGIDGSYDPITFEYLPPKGYTHWEEVIQSKSITLKVKNSVFIY